MLKRAIVLYLMSPSKIEKEIFKLYQVVRFVTVISLAQ